VILKSRTLSRTSDAIETQNLCVISHLFFNLFNLFWHTDKNFCFYAEVNFWDFARNDNSNKGTTARLNVVWYSWSLGFFCLISNKKIRGVTSTRLRLNETRFGPKNKSSPIYLGPKNLDTFWCTGWAWNCQIIFRCVSIHGRAGFILFCKQEEKLLFFGSVSGCTCLILNEVIS
jgi:hypothetical protein